MGTPEFAVRPLQQLVLAWNVIGVITQPDRPAGRGRRTKATPVKEAARELGIPVYQPTSLRSPEALSRLRDWQPDAIVVVAYGQILPQAVLDLPSQGCINVHASLLPRWRGAAPIQHAILAGDQITGVSIMRLDAGMDTGPVYVQKNIPINDADTAGDLHDKLAVLGAETLVDHLQNILEAKIQAKPQNDSEATYAPPIKKEDGQIDWTQPGSYIGRHVRAMTPWPGAFTRWQGMHFKIISGQPYMETPLPPGNPGDIKKIGDNIFVLAAEGAFTLLEVQLAGKRVTKIEDFVRGRTDFIGSSFQAEPHPS